jgi:Domain of unknown function (DUF4281)
LSKNVDVVNLYVYFVNIVKPETVFLVANQLAVVGWLILLLSWFVPFLRVFVKAAIIPLLFAVAYTAVVLSSFGGSGGDFSSLAGVMKLFTSPWAVTAGWIHYLAFDMFVGMWEFHDAKKHGMPFWAMLPCWFLTFMFGPIGLLLYFLVRFSGTRSVLFGGGL